MCKHCRRWVDELDEYEGVAAIREGFFVYQLDTGYIGMTYNPSQRQKEHEVRQYVERRERSDNPIKNPDTYITACIENDWARECREHWESVRKSDKRYKGERRIQWMSTRLNSRKKAFRCEWALKALEILKFMLLIHLTRLQVYRLFQ